MKKVIAALRALNPHDGNAQTVQEIVRALHLLATEIESSGSDRDEDKAPPAPERSLVPQGENMITLPANETDRHELLAFLDWQTARNAGQTNLAFPAWLETQTKPQTETAG